MLLRNGQRDLVRMSVVRNGLSSWAPVKMRRQSLVVLDPISLMEYEDMQIQNDDGIISAEEVFYYAEPRSAQMQHPTLYDGYDGELPIMNTATTGSTNYEHSIQLNMIQNDDVIESSGAIC